MKYPKKRPLQVTQLQKKLNKTYKEIHKVKKSISENISSDLLSIDIKQAIFFLGELTGEISNDEVLRNILSIVQISFQKTTYFVIEKLIFSLVFL